MSSIITFVQQNPALVGAASAILSLILHSLSGAYPRIVAAIQAVSIDLPKLWAAITNTLPPASAEPTGSPYRDPLTLLNGGKSDKDGGK